MTETPPLIFDRELVRMRRARAARQTGRDGEFLRKLAAEELLDRVMSVTRDFPRALALGGGGAFGRAWAGSPAARAKIARLVEADVALPALGGGPSERLALVADEERLPLADAAFDLIVAPLGLHLVNDLPGAFIQLRRALKPDGLLIARLFARGSLDALRAAFLAAEAETPAGPAPRIAPLPDLQDLAGLLQRAGLAMPVTDRDEIIARYPDPLSLMADLRAMGETNALVARPRTPLSRAVLMRVCEIYPREADGRCAARFSFVTATGWAPAPSQPKPLRPGSATVRLADALGVSEKGAGEPAVPADRRED